MFVSSSEKSIDSRSDCAIQEFNKILDLSGQARFFGSFGISIKDILCSYDSSVTKPAIHLIHSRSIIGGLCYPDLNFAFFAKRAQVHTDLFFDEVGQSHMKVFK